ncbi:hypothetical protein DB30_03658 [Enhygromyxa salina]|uniref:Uncharacterized protein n=1 Tax=Enhygromyxa salina TaxID=215803 RepID=A0A0C2D1F0_9BACT|nr:hypothetical protein [Enhygromyxa salina]KIG17061.1 hypothetical protein DB30_03658 [Enhygromyxa salina]
MTFDLFAQRALRLARSSDPQLETDLRRALAARLPRYDPRARVFAVDGYEARARVAPILPHAEFRSLQTAATLLIPRLSDPSIDPSVRREFVDALGDYTRATHAATRVLRERSAAHGGLHPLAQAAEPLERSLDGISEQIASMSSQLESAQTVSSEQLQQLGGQLGTVAQELGRAGQSVGVNRAAMGILVGQAVEQSIEGLRFHPEVREVAAALTSHMRDPNATQDSIRALETQLEAARETARADRARFDAIGENIEVAGQVVDLAALLLGAAGEDELANQVAVVGGSALAIAEAVRNVVGAAVLGIATDPLGALLEVTGAVMDIVGLFGESSPTPEELILEEIAKLAEQVEELRVEVHARFDKIEDLLSDMRREFLQQFASLAGDLRSVSRTLSKVHRQVLELEDTLEAGLDALYRQNYHSSREAAFRFREDFPDRTLSEPKMLEYYQHIRDWALSAPQQALFVGDEAVASDDLAALAEELRQDHDSVERNLRGLLMLAARIDPDFADISLSRLANPIVWAEAVGTFGEFLERFPEFPVTAPIQIRMGEALRVIRETETFVAHIQRSQVQQPGSLFGALAARHIALAQAVAATVEQRVADRASTLVAAIIDDPNQVKTFDEDLRQNPRLNDVVFMTERLHRLGDELTRWVNESGQPTPAPAPANPTPATNTRDTVIEVRLDTASFDFGQLWFCSDWLNRIHAPVQPNQTLRSAAAQHLEDSLRCLEHALPLAALRLLLARIMGASIADGPPKRIHDAGAPGADEVLEWVAQLRAKLAEPDTRAELEVVAGLIAFGRAQRIPQLRPQVLESPGPRGQELGLRRRFISAFTAAHAVGRQLEVERRAVGRVDGGRVDGLFVARLDAASVAALDEFRQAFDAIDQARSSMGTYPAIRSFQALRTANLQMPFDTRYRAGGSRIQRWLHSERQPFPAPSTGDNALSTWQYYLLDLHAWVSATSAPSHGSHEGPAGSVEIPLYIDGRRNSSHRMFGLLDRFPRLREFQALRQILEHAFGGWLLREDDLTFDSPHLPNPNTPWQTQRASDPLDEDFTAQLEEIGKILADFDTVFSSILASEAKLPAADSRDAVAKLARRLERGELSQELGSARDQPTPLTEQLSALGDNRTIVSGYVSLGFRRSFLERHELGEALANLWATDQAGELWRDGPRFVRGEHVTNAAARANAALEQELGPYTERARAQTGGDEAEYPLITATRARIAGLMASLSD